MRGLILSLFLVLGLNPAAQAYTPDLGGVGTLPLQVVPSPFVAKTISDAIQPRKGEGPYKFATAIAFASGLDQGSWEDAGGGLSRWRTRLVSEGATSLSFEFAEYAMPEGGELWVYDQNGEAVQGPYTAQNQNAEGKLWTALVAGENAVIEARVPSAARDQFHLALGRVFHGNTDPFKNSLISGAPSAGSCNINVACSAGDAWTSEARATVALVYQDSACTGVLVNHLPQTDNTPYILTANHCRIRSSDGFEGGDPVFSADSVTVYWRYQAATCEGSTGNSGFNQLGTTVMAGDAATDFTLLQLDAAPVAGANPYFAGWDVTNTPATSGAGLHHPVADLKKISRFSRTLLRDQISLGGNIIDVWRVPRWAQGVTEGGSSGSGLWNEEHRIVGLLSGGRSQCDVEFAGTTFPRGPQQPDFYARLDKAWAAGLGNQLAPGSSVTVLCGRDRGAAACAAESRAVNSDSYYPPSSGESGGGGGGSMSVGLLLFLMLAVLLKLTSRRPSRA